MKRMISAAVGTGMALFPLIALAERALAHAGAESRAVPTTADMSMIVLITALALTALFVVVAVGYLYRRERHLDWPFQAPAAPQDYHH